MNTVPTPPGEHPGNMYPVEIISSQNGRIKHHPEQFFAREGIPGSPEDENLPEKYYEALDEISTSWRIIRDPITGKKFEIAETGLGVDPEEGIDAEFSTYSSSISGNAGNAAEFAWHSMVNPGRRRLYVATMGNGSSDNFTNGELAHLRKTGRLTWEDKHGKTVALPTIRALYGALKEEDLSNVQRISTDSFGGSIATALMSELAPGQVTHAYMKGRTNIRSHSAPALAWKMLIQENLVNSKRNQAETTDPWSLHRNNGVVVAVAKLWLANIYEQKHERAAGSKFKQLASYLIGLSRGQGQDGSPAPAVVDTVAALRRQSDAKVTIDMPKGDLLYAGKAEQYAERVVRDLGTLVVGNMAEVVISSGTHNGHGYYPMQRDASERYAFTR